MASKRRAPSRDDLLSALDLPFKGQRGRPCRMRVILDSVDPEIRAKVSAIIEEMRAARNAELETTYSATWLAQVLTDHGYKVTSHVIGIHVRRQCRCD